MRRSAPAVWLTALLAVGCCVAGCGGGSAVNDLGTVVKGAKGATVPVEFAAGRRFSLAVPDDPAAGDHWSLVAVPDPRVAAELFLGAIRSDVYLRRFIGLPFEGGEPDEPAIERRIREAARVFVRAYQGRG